MIMNPAPLSATPLPESVPEGGYREIPSPNLITAGRIGVFITLLFGPFLGHVRPELQAIPLLASILFFGLPHGALDHRVAARLSGVYSGFRGQTIFFSLYILLMGVYLGVWWFLPVLGFGSFLLLTLIHWGHGELWVVRGCGWRRANGFKAWLGIFLRGGAPILIPIVVHPNIVAEVGSWAMGLFGPIDLAEFREGLELLRVPLSALYGMGFAVYAVLGCKELRSEGRSTTRYAQDLGELLLLILFFGLVSPLMAIGVYFTLWHSLRHIDRLRWTLGTVKETNEDRRRFRTRMVPLEVSAVLIRSIPLTLAALVLLVGLALWVQAGLSVAPGERLTMKNLIGLYLLLLALLTLPHTLLVFAMDRSQSYTIRSLPANGDPESFQKHPKLRYRRKYSPEKLPCLSVWR